MRCLLLLLCCVSTYAAQSATSAPLNIGYTPAPPFVMEDIDGARPGISVELWRLIGEELGREPRFEAHGFAALLKAAADGEVDAAMAAITVTEEREAQLDFTHAFYGGGLGIAVRNQSDLFTNALLLVVNPYFLGALGVLCLLLLIMGCIIWLLERRRNPEQFGRPGLGGLSDGFWWSAVTMTTVGYGDKAPITPLGRMLAIWWMFASVFLVSGFAATIASTLTATQISGSVADPSDLHSVQVGVIRSATSAQYAADRDLDATTFDHLAQALQALGEGRVKAVIHDRPLLRYRVQERADDELTVLPHLLRAEDYAYALPNGSPLREPVNRALLRITERGDLQAIIARYLGD